MSFNIGVLFNKVAGLHASNFIKKRLQHNCFPVNTAKCLQNNAEYHEQFPNKNMVFDDWQPPWFDRKIEKLISYKNQI